MRTRLAVLAIGFSLLLPTAQVAQAAPETGVQSSSQGDLTGRAAAIAGTPKQILSTIPVVSPLRNGFKQGLFPSLTSKAKDKRGCTLYNQMLIKLATKTPRVGGGCKLTGGLWTLDFGAKTTTKPSDVRLTKLLPDAYIWGQGASQWTQAQRSAFSTAVSKVSSSSKMRSRPRPIIDYSGNYIINNISNYWIVSRNNIAMTNRILNLMINNADPDQIELARLQLTAPALFQAWTVATLMNLKAWGLSLSPNMAANFQVNLDNCLAEICKINYTVPNEGSVFNIVAVPQIASEVAVENPAILASYSAPTMPAVGRDLFGIHAPADWFSDVKSGTEGPTDPATIPTVPVGYVRMWDTETTWRDLEPTKGTFVWRKLSKQIETAQVLNAKVMMVLGGTPAWAGNGSAADNPKSIADWSAYVRAVACKYGPAISSYEIWNEANLQTFYTGTPAQMADLTAAAFKEIRACNPNALVVAANTTSRATGSFGTFFPAYLEELKTRNWPADAYSVHSYPTASGGADDRIRGVAQFRTMLALSGAPFTTVFDSETNYGLAGLGEGKIDITGDKAMALLSRSYIDSVRYGFGSTFWYVWTKSPDPKFGIQLTPANTDEQQAWRQTYDWLIGAQLQRCATPKDGLVVCQFSKGAENFSLVWYGDASDASPAFTPSKGYFGPLGSNCQTLRGADCAGILNGTAPLGFMPVRISGAPSAAAVAIPASISMTPEGVAVGLNQTTTLTVTVLDGAGKPVFDQEVRATATGSARFEGGNTVKNGRTNAQGQLTLSVTRVGANAAQVGTITVVPDTGAASLKATSTLSAPTGIVLKTAVVFAVSQGTVTGTAPAFAGSSIELVVSSPAGVFMQRRFTVSVDADGNFKKNVLPVRPGFTVYAIDNPSTPTKSNTLIFR